MARTIAKDHDQKRAQILKAAAKTFAREGFDRASMNMLARECGISKANIYHYYPSKDALLFDVLDTYLAALRDRVLGLDLAGISPEEQLHQTVHEILLAYQGMDDEHQVQTAGLTALSQEQQEILRGYQRDMVRQMSGILRALAPERFSEDRAKLRGAVMSVFGMLNWYYMWHPGADAQARAEYARMVADLTIGGLTRL